MNHQFSVESPMCAKPQRDHTFGSAKSEQLEKAYAFLVGLSPGEGPPRTSPGYSEKFSSKFFVLESPLF